MDFRRIKRLPEHRVLTRREAAVLLGKSPSQMANYCRNGVGGKLVEVSRGEWRCQFTRADLMAISGWIEQNGRNRQ